MFGAVAGFDDPHEEFERIVRRVYESVLRPGDGAVDAGAHVGKHTIPIALAVQDEGWVVAVEPLPWAAERLRERVEHSDLGSVVEIVCGCLGAEDAVDVGFVEVVDRPGWSSLAARSRASTTVDHVVPQSTVDGLTAGRPTRFVKIDVEGGELGVLAGATETIRRDHPVIHVEVAADAIDANGWDASELFAVLESFGYDVFDLIGNDLLAADLWRGLIECPGPVEHFESFDVIAVRPDDPAHDDVVRCLLTSFGAQRTDLAAHEVVALVGSSPPVRDRPFEPASVAGDHATSLRDELLEGVRHPAASVWPVGNSAIETKAISWTSAGAYLLDFNVTTVELLAGGVAVRLPIGASELRSEGDVEVRLRVRGQFKRNKRRHQTMCEFDLGPEIGAGVVRWNRRGAIDAVWVHGDRTVTSSRLPCRRLRALEVTLTRRGDVVAIGATEQHRSITAAVRVRAHAGPIVVSIGRRRAWPSEEPLDLDEIGLSADVVDAPPPGALAVLRRPAALKAAVRRVAKTAAHRLPGGMSVVRSVRRLTR